MEKKVILGVDDEPHLNMLVKDSLELADYTVISALTAEEALEKLRKNKVDLVLVDIMLPGMSGVELCEKIRADSKLKNIPVAFLSALQPAEIGIEKINALKVQDYIKKPFDYRDLVIRVKKIIG